MDIFSTKPHPYSKSNNISIYKNISVILHLPVGIQVNLGHVQSHTFCYGFRVERHASWKRCAARFDIRFLLFGGCVKKVSPISSNMYRNHAVLKRRLAQWVQVKSFTNVSASKYATIEDIRRHVCRQSFIGT